MSGDLYAKIAQLQEALLGLEKELEQNLAAQQEKFNYSLLEKRVFFEASVQREHLQFKSGLGKFLRETRPLVFLTAPLIYAMIIPLVAVDVFFTVFQHICFRVYRLKLVPRRPYMVADRYQLGYLNLIQKFNCLYCSYGNGVIAYAREITARTEDFWCPIKNAGKVRTPHHKYYEFLEFGDAQGFQKWQTERDARFASNRSDPEPK